MKGVQLIAGSSHPQLAQEISQLLKAPLTPVDIRHFSDGEIYVRIKEKVRGDDVYVIQSLNAPANDHLMETLIMIDALRRASVGRINLVCPYLCYSRQDRKVSSREAISSKLVANLITKAGADRLLTFDLHADQIQGFYDIPVDHFLAYPLFAKYLKSHKLLSDAVIVSPDMGGVKRANKMADMLGLKLAIIDKVRRAHDQSEVAHVVGEVEGKRVILLDDVISTGGSICAAAETLKKFGAKEVIVCITHGALSGDSKEKVGNGHVDRLLLTNSIDIPAEKLNHKMTVISLGPLLAKVIRRIAKNQSVGALFTWEDKPVKM
ncbi:ribose-phosphate pyrophosphokinase [Patescibacteria group bacterium]|nr:ribose-phosphate pyrophosphokinase [Patescibacteria group bacterium]